MSGVLTDDSLMPFGKFEGTSMANVPHWYLLTIYEKGCSNSDVMDYVNDNIDAIKLEAKRESSRKNSTGRWDDID